MKYYKLNERGRDYVVGDLHGCRALLLNTLRDIEFKPEIDRLFSVGDLIDRGADSMGCLRLLEEPWFHAVLGNHEEFMIDTMLYGKDPYSWDNNGGSWRKFVDEKELFRLAYLADETMPLSFTVETPRGLIGICHAEPPSFNWEDVKKPTEVQRERMLWGRTRVNSGTLYPTKNIYKTYHGHTPVIQRVIVANANFIDNSAVYTGVLSMHRINWK